MDSEDALSPESDALVPNSGADAPQPSAAVPLSQPAEAPSPSKPPFAFPCIPTWRCLIQETIHDRSLAREGSISGNAAAVLKELQYKPGIVAQCHLGAAALRPVKALLTVFKLAWTALVHANIHIQLCTVRNESRVQQCAMKP